MTVFKKKKRIIKLNAIKCRLVIIMYWIEYIFDKSGLYASFIVNMTQLLNIIVFGAKKRSLDNYSTLRSLVYNPKLFLHRPNSQ